MIQSHPSPDPALRRRLLAFGAIGYLYLGAVIAIAVALAAYAIAHGVWQGALFSAVFVWLVVATLHAAVPAPYGVRVSRAEQPALFRAIDRARGALRAPPVDTVVVTGELNAAVVERPALGIVGPARRWLVVGLPLLHALPTDEVEAILAHEFAHLARGDGRSTRWVGRVAVGWERLVASLQARQSWIGPLFLPFLRWYLPRLETLLAGGSRAAELEADRLAARAAGAETFARALVRLQVRQRQEAFALLPSLLAGSRDAAAPPGDAFERLLGGLRAPVGEDAAAGDLSILLRDRTLGEHSHPSLADRTEALGAARTAAEWSAELARTPSSAADTLLEPSDSLQALAGEAWTAGFGMIWEECRLDVLTMERETDAGGSAARWARARWAARCEPPAAAIPLLRAFVAEHPSHHEAMLELGLLLSGHAPEREAEEGAALLERVAATESIAALRAAEALQEHYARAGWPESVARCRRRTVELRHAAMRNLRESGTLGTGDVLRPYRPVPAAVEALAAELEARPRVERAYLVEKRTRALPGSPVVVLALEVAVPWYRPTFGSANALLCEELLPLLPAPPGADRLVVALESGRVRRRLRRLAGAEVFRRGHPVPAMEAPREWSAPSGRIGAGHLVSGGAALAFAGLLALAWANRSDGSGAASTAQLRAEAREHPGDALALERLGFALAEEERWVAAESAFAAAVAADSTREWAFAMLGWVRFRDRRCDAAVEPLRRALLLDSDLHDAEHTLWTCQMELGEVRQAEAGLADLALRAPDNAPLLADLGRARAELARFDEAEAHFRRALELEPGFFPARYGLARLHMRRGDLAAAETAFRELAGDHPGEVYLWLDIGHVAHLSGDYAGSAAAFDEAHRLDPGYFERDEYLRGMREASREGRIYTYPE